MRTRRVVPPLNATSRQRTRRMRRPSAASAAVSIASPASPAVPAGAPSGIGQTVPDAADGLDPVPDVAELRAEVMDVGVNRVWGDGHAERPGLVEQLIAGQG